MVLVDSPSLQAKKQARDAKRKKLEEAFHQHKKQLEIPSVIEASEGGESTCEEEEYYSRREKQSTCEEQLPTPSSYLSGSYQHQQQNAGENNNIDIEKGMGGIGIKSSVKEEEEATAQQQQSSSSLSSVPQIINDNHFSLRDEVQSLIHHNPQGDVLPDQSTILEKFESKPKQVVGAICLFGLLWWWM